MHGVSINGMYFAHRGAQTFFLHHFALSSLVGPIVSICISNLCMSCELPKKQRQKPSDIILRRWTEIRVDRNKFLAEAPEPDGFQQAILEYLDSQVLSIECPCKCHLPLTETHVIEPEKQLIPCEVCEDCGSLVKKSGHVCNPEEKCGSQCPLIGVTVKNGRKVGVCAEHGVQEPKPEFGQTCKHEFFFDDVGRVKGCSCDPKEPEKCAECQMLSMELDIMRQKEKEITTMLEVMAKTGGEVDEKAWGNQKERNLVLQGMNWFVVNLLKSL